MTNTNQIVKYEADSGQHIELSSEIIRAYLVNKDDDVTDQEEAPIEQIFIDICSKVA